MGPKHAQLSGMQLLSIARAAFADAAAARAFEGGHVQLHIHTHQQACTLALRLE